MGPNVTSSNAAGRVLAKVSLQGSSSDAVGMPVGIMVFLVVEKSAKKEE